MNKVLKIILILAGVLVALIVVAVIAAYILIDPNEFREPISKAVKEKTGRELTFHGDLNLSVFPWIAVSVDPVSLENAEGFGDKPMMRLEGASLRVRLLPLFGGNVEVGKVVLDGLTLNLAKKEDGTSNWDDLTEAATTETTTTTEPAPAPSGEGRPMGSLTVEGVTITEVNINYRDGEKVSEFHLKDASVNVGKLEPGKPFDVDMSFTLDSTNPNFTTDVALNGTAMVDTEKQVYTFSVASLSAEGSGKDLPVERFNADMSAELRAEQKADLVKVSGLNFNAAASGGALPDEEVKAAVKADITAHPEAGTATISGIDATAAGVNLTGKVDARNINKAPAYSGALNVATFNPGDALGKLGVKLPPMSDSEAMTKASAETEFSGTQNSLDVNRLVLAIDDTTAKGSAAVRNFSQPAITFDFAVDKLNADRYLPPKAEKKEEKKEGKGEKGKTELPTEQLRKLDVNGEVFIAQLTFKGTKSEDVDVVISAKDGLLQIKSADLKAYGGTMDASAYMDVRGDTPEFNFRNMVKSLAFGPLLLDLVGKETLTGEGGLNMDLTTRGLDAKQMLKALDGNASLSLANGTVRGINIAKIIRNATALLKGQQLAADEPDTTDFVGLSAGLNIKDGVLQNNDLSLESPILNVRGEGMVDLVGKKVDYLLNTSVVGDLSRKVDMVKGVDLSNVTVPIKVSGSLTDLNYLVDPKTLVKELARKQGKQLLQDKLDEQFGDKMLDAGGKSGGAAGAGGNLLDSVLGGGKSQPAQQAPAETQKPDAQTDAEETGSAPSREEKAMDAVKGLFGN
ncbi:MAG: AsmA family protein [Desulfatibacillaceae bacterium]